MFRVVFQIKQTKERKERKAHSHLSSYLEDTWPVRPDGATPAHLHHGNELLASITRKREAQKFAGEGLELQQEYIQPRLSDAMMRVH